LVVERIEFDPDGRLIITPKDPTASKAEHAVERRPAEDVCAPEVLS
jgi:hypothetical protein